MSKVVKGDMNIKTQILNTGFVMGGPQLAQMLRDKQDEWDREIERVVEIRQKPSWLRNQKPRRRALRWML